ncbi:hypothetical protein [Sphingomonas sp. Leaf4]|uniref:hypothetical protein n=1 Tax=Sphingomonas sp. Leaf4 TaxID=2876553 RepID=UPI001E30D241|nr:hypothetical protein [Sphingomonas sp. Leaf4]
MMDSDNKAFDDNAMDSLAVAPDGSEQDAGVPARGDAGEDATINDRVEDQPNDHDARLDEGLDETMDASDPVSISQPSHLGGPAPSSGYDAEAEAKRASQQD